MLGRGLAKLPSEEALQGYLWKMLLGVTVFAGGAILFHISGFPVSPTMDFSQLYADLYAIARGAPLYDEKSHESLFSAIFPERAITLNPPGYPPWYYLSLLPLGFLSPESAARLWLYLNVVALFFSLDLLTRDCSPARRALVFSSAFLFGPTIGHLVVGQQTLIVVLGGALLAGGLSERSWSKVFFGVVFVSFKPHLGIPVLGFLGVRLLFRERGQLAPFLLTVGTAGGFLVSSALIWEWGSLTSYGMSLHRLSSLGINQVCNTCSSLSIIVAPHLWGESLTLWTARLVTSGAIFLILLFMVTTYSKSLFAAVGAAMAGTLVGAPYARNYDYVLLMVPLVMAFSVKEWSGSKATPATLLLGAISWLFVTAVSLIGSREFQAEILWVGALCAFLAALTVRVR